MPADAGGERRRWCSNVRPTRRSAASTNGAASRCRCRRRVTRTGSSHVRFSGAAAPRSTRRAQVGGDALADAAAFWTACASKRSRSSTRRAARRCGGCRSRSTAPFTDLGGEQMVEWGGALRWLRRASRRSMPARFARSPPRTAAMRRCFAVAIGQRRVPSAAAGDRWAASAPQGHLRSRAHPQSRPHVRRPLMETRIAAEFAGTRDGNEAEAILRACVHCGFCTATCPTYQLLGDELDGPRGRIYLMKQVLEGAAPTAQDATPSRPLPDLPQLRDHVPVGRPLRRAGGHRPAHRRAQGRAAARRSRAALFVAQGPAREAAVRRGARGRPRRQGVAAAPARASAFPMRAPPAHGRRRGMRGGC